MEQRAVDLAWDAGAEGNRWNAASSLDQNGNTVQKSKACSVIEICCSYCCSLSMKGILMMLTSTTRGDFAQPHGLETERDGNAAQMSSATCSPVFLHTLKSSLQYEQYTYFILCHTEGGGGSCINPKLFIF